MGELELETSIERMVAARWNKAERGELYTIPPAGYDLDERGQWVMSSDAAVVHPRHMVLDQFDALGSAPGVLLMETPGAQLSGEAVAPRAVSRALA